MFLHNVPYQLNLYVDKEVQIFFRNILHLLNKYKRKAMAMRGNWSEEWLKAAVNAVNDELLISAAGLQYQISKKTLERRIKKNNKKGPIYYFI